MKTLRGAELVVQTFEAQGVDTLFGIPGIHNLDIYDALLNSSIRHITARHEQGAGFMADGYARSSQKTGVALVITGPGLTNIMTPMAQAFHDSIPLVIISSQLPSGLIGQRSGFLHELQNSTIMASSAAKESRCVTSANDIPRYIQDAFRLANSGRPGPVHVEIPMDVLRQEIPMPPDPELSIAPSAVLPVPEEALTQTIRHLEQASRPLLILGGGACRTGEGIRDFVERIGAVVLETCAGKGTLDERHPLCLGARFHFNEVREYIKKADVVLALGTNFSPTDLWEMPFDCDGALIQVNRDPADFLRNGRSGVEIVADVAEFVPQLLQRLKQSPALDDATQTVATLKHATQQQTETVTGMGAQYPFMLEMLGILREELPEDAIMCFDMTGPAYVGISEFPAYTPRSFLHPVGFGTLGHALPAAIGAKLANPERAVCAFAGDGGFQFTLPELAVACQERVALPVILWNNHGFGEIRRYEDARRPGHRIAVDLENPDFTHIAKAYNIPAIPVRTGSDFRQALAQALAASQPVLIEIHAEGER